MQHTQFLLDEVWAMRFFPLLRRIYVLLFVYLLCFVQPLFGEEIVTGITVKTNPKTYYVKVAVDFEVIRAPDTLILAFPIPATNEYQDVKRIKASHGRVFKYKENDQEFLFCRFENRQIPEQVSHEFEITLYDIEVDFSKITKINPYDKTTDFYRRYTSKAGELIDPANLKIKKIAEEIGKDITSSIVFAQRAYEHVGDHYKYVPHDFSNRTLNTLFRLGGGDCGQLSAIYISILRSHGIPARHIVGMKPGSADPYELHPHMLAEFYLENYGWIPVDATGRVRDKNKNHFGRMNVAEYWNGIVFSRDNNMSVFDLQGNPRIVGFMQQFFWDYSRTPTGRKIDYRYSLESKLLEPKAPD